MTTYSTYQPTTTTTTTIPTNTLSTVNTFTFGLPTPLINDRKPVSAPTSLKRSSLQVPPNSENLKQNSVLSSPESRLLEKWNEDLQQYDITLEKLSSLENNVKEEIKHVDQWFRYLNETERTATLYVLLQHSSPVQLRFFMTVLKQLSQQDPINDIYASPPPSSSSTTNTTNFAEKEMVTQYPVFNENKKETSFYPSTTYDPFNTSFMDDPLFKRPLSEHLFTNNNNNSNSALSNWSPSPSSSSISTGLLQKNKKLNHDISPPIEHVVTRPKSADISQWSFGGSSFTSNNTFSNHSPTKNLSTIHSAMHHLSPSTSSPHISTTTTTTTTNTAPAVTTAASRMTWQGISSSSSSSSPKRNSFYESNLYHHSTPSLTNKSSSPVLSSSSSPSTYDDPFFLTKLNQLSLYNNNNNINNNNNTNKRFSLDNHHHHHHHNTMNNHHQLHKPMISPNDTQRYRRQSYHIPNDHNIMINHSAPPPPHSIYQQRNNMKTINNNNNNNNSRYVNNNNLLENNNSNNNQNTMNLSKERKNLEEIDMKILEDVPVWLRSLRLHKYNSIFETMTWQEMIILTDEELLSKGVMALGARRKLLKVFDQVKLHCDKNGINY
ncbi:unnamed protein product [Cunninghamella echinulata]